MDTFDALELPLALVRNVIKAKYTRPTPVQKYTIPLVLAGRDIMACAQTGACACARDVILTCRERRESESFGTKSTRQRGTLRHTFFDTDKLISLP